MNFKTFLFALSLAGCAFAAPSFNWAYVYSSEYTTDKSPSTLNRQNYTAYCCEKVVAEERFGSGTAMADYLSKNVAAAKAFLGASGMELKGGDWSGELDARYSFTTLLDSAVPELGDYLAFVFYKDEGFRVLSVYDADLRADGNLLFEESPGQGAWTAAVNVPEPTSGFLLLVGGMLLGLRRKRA